MAMGGGYSELTRCVSTASSVSHGSGTDISSPDSLRSDLVSRQSSGSYRSRQSDVSSGSRRSARSVDSHTRRRGYVRPHGTDFAASARSRDSVMSLGSIAHLQYYFARTGLLDGKGGQLARKKTSQRGHLDMAVLRGTSDYASIPGSDADPADASLSVSPDLEPLPENKENKAPSESPVDSTDEDYFEDSFTSDPEVLPPTVSTYQQKATPVPKPPAIDELKAELVSTLQEAKKALEEVEDRNKGEFEASEAAPELPNMPEENTQGWYELQGMHILDVVTLAIRAAKMYYTAHEMPDRLDSIKTEKQIRTDLLAVMEVLKQMATRNFKGGMRGEEISTITAWVESVFGILQREREIEESEGAERQGWIWLSDEWSGRELERERAFLSSMDPDAEPLPEWMPLSASAECPTPFLSSMQNGLRLVKLHNAVVKRSRRRFGAIPAFHADTQKPYRCAENLRFWVKAAELRFEVLLKVDVMGVVCNAGPEAWRNFETAILKWCKHLREEITAELTS